MKTAKLGPDGPEVSVIGLSCLAMSDAVASDDDGIATIHAAVDGGVTPATSTEPAVTTRRSCAKRCGACGAANGC
jgi:hypothetical protein